MSRSKQPLGVAAGSEESFLRSQRRKGRTPNAVRAIEMVRKATTVEFFQRMLTDEVEHQMWLMFMTGKAQKVDEHGKPVLLDGKPIFEDIELNPISLKAFLRAVEYKRGMPVQVVKDESETKAGPVIVHVIGANDAFFEKQAKVRGLLGSPVETV